MNNASDNKPEQKAGLLELVEKIPVFSDLSIGNRKKILALCSKMVLYKSETLFVMGDESSALFILLMGKLVVKVENSAVAVIDPVTSIGEMGVFTGEPRSATIEAMEKSALLTLKKGDLDRFIEANPETGVKIMRRVIGILAGRVTTDNIRIREFQNYLLE
jgi:CRP/FNR family transcriptional regulator, cyclic AMP receptor protein